MSKYYQQKPSLGEKTQKKREIRMRKRKVLKSESALNVSDWFLLSIAS